VRYDRYIIRFCESDLIEGAAQVLSAILDGEGGSRCFCFSGEVSDTIVSIFEHSQISRSLPEPHAQSYCRMLISELVHLFSIARSERAMTYEGEIGARLIKYLNEHINRNLSLDFLAKKFFVSKYYLCRVFKKHNGISIHGYVMQKRVMLAKQLIEGGASARYAAKKVGFHDYSAFYRAYTKVLGEAPSTRGIKKNGEGEENGI
jgi:AraC-like DNA-binding protein